MSKFYFLPTVYDPNTAATNRALSYIKGFSELGITSNVIFFRPNKNFDKISESYKNVHFRYYWKFCYFNNSIFKYISLLFYLIHFLFTLRSGDIVFCYNNAEIWSQILRFRRGVKLYVEYTEHPNATGIGGRFLTPSMQNFYKLIAKVDGLFVITTALRDFYISKGVPASKIHITNITVDASRFQNIEKKLDVVPYIAYCGTVSNNKDGVDLLIKSFSQVVRKYPEFKLYIIGSTPTSDELTKNQKLIEELGIKDSVVLTGVVTADKMPQLLKDAQILALNRPDNLQARNGFATKIGEYLLTENPVVLTAVGDFPLFFKDGVNAYLSSPDNINEFAKKLMEVLSDYERARMIGKNGANTARKYFSYNFVTSSICKVMGLIK